jgi:hypothetical protein
VLVWRHCPLALTLLAHCHIRTTAATIRISSRYLHQCIYLALEASLLAVLANADANIVKVSLRNFGDANAIVVSPLPCTSV